MSETPEIPEAVEAPETAPKAGSEAARWRTQFRDAETRLTAAQGRIDGFLRADAERIAGAHLDNAADLFEIGKVDLSDLLDEGGNVDPDKVSDASTALVADRPKLAATPAEPVGGLFEGVMGTRGIPSVGDGPTWTDVLRGQS